MPIFVFASHRATVRAKKKDPPWRARVGHPPANCRSERGRESWRRWDLPKSLVRFVLCVLGVAAAALSLCADANTFGQNSSNKNQASSQGTIAGSRRDKVANPLNDLLQEAQRDIEKTDFAAAIDPLQKFIAL